MLDKINQWLAICPILFSRIMQDYCMFTSQAQTVSPNNQKD